MLNVPIVQPPAPAVTRAAASAAPPAVSLFGRNGQLRSSGLDLTSDRVIDALIEKEQAKELKQERKKRKVEDQALRAAAAPPRVKHQRRSAPLRPWTPEPEADEEKENAPPAASSAYKGADPVVSARVSSVSPSLLAAVCNAYPSLSLATADAVCPSILLR